MAGQMPVAVVLRPSLAPPVVCTRGIPSAGAAQTAPSGQASRPRWSPVSGLLWRSPPRGGPPPWGGGGCPGPRQLAARLRRFLSRALRPPLRPNPGGCIRSTHPQPPLARGGRMVCLPCSPSQPVELTPLLFHVRPGKSWTAMLTLMPLSAAWAMCTGRGGWSIAEGTGATASAAGIVLSWPWSLFIAPRSPPDRLEAKQLCICLLSKRELRY